MKSPTLQLTLLFSAMIVLSLLFVVHADVDVPTGPTNITGLTGPTITPGPVGPDNVTGPSALPLGPTEGPVGPLVIQGKVRVDDATQAFPWYVVPPIIAVIAVAAMILILRKSKIGKTDDTDVQEAKD